MIITIPTYSGIDLSFKKKKIKEVSPNGRPIFYYYRLVNINVLYHYLTFHISKTTLFD